MKKKARATGFQDVTCSKCENTGHSKSGSKHRRCPGQKGAIKDKRAERLSFQDRGVWS